MAFKSDKQRRAAFAHMKRPAGLTNHKINELRIDERGAHTEYGNFAEKSSNPKIKRLFSEMSEDEHKHYKYLKVIGDEVNENTEIRKNRMNTLKGQQAFSKAELQDRIKTYPELTIKKDVKPSWTDKWQQTYTIVEV